MNDNRVGLGLMRYNVFKDNNNKNNKKNKTKNELYSLGAKVIAAGGVSFTNKGKSFCYYTFYLLYSLLSFYFQNCPKFQNWGVFPQFGLGLLFIRIRQ